MSTASSSARLSTSRVNGFKGVPMSRLIALFALLPLAAAAQQEPPAFRIGDCYKDMWSDVRSAPVVKRLGFGHDPIPLALRASKAVANAKEKESLEFVAAAMQKCQQLDQPNRANYHPLIKQVVDGYEAGYRSVLTRAYSGDLTWGAAIEANEANQAAFDKQYQDLLARASAHQKEEAERQALAEEQRKAALRADFERQKQLEIQQKMLEQQRQEQASRDIINSLQLMQRPRPGINCRSTQFFDTVTTNCY